MALVVLDRAHAGKGPGSGDRGASADLDGDGVVESHEREAAITPYYILAAELALLAAGHDVIVVSDGSYDARQRRAIGYGADVYVACHLNAGNGDYGLAVHNAGSMQGQRLATAITGRLRAACPELSRVVVGDTVGFPRAASCIGTLATARPIGIVYEPAFLDRAAHQPLLRAGGEGLTRIGQALAEGIDAWWRGPR